MGEVSQESGKYGLEMRMRKDHVALPCETA